MAEAQAETAILDCETPPGLQPIRQDTFDKVKDCIVGALSVDDDEVIPNATIFGDLGAESIDYLDILSRLEKAFEVEIPRQDLFPEDILTNAEHIDTSERKGSAKLNTYGLAKLRERMGEFTDMRTFEERPYVRKFGNLHTVANWCRYMEYAVIHNKQLEMRPKMYQTPAQRIFEE